MTEKEKQKPNEDKDAIIKNAILNHLKIMWGNCKDDVCGVHVEDAIDWVEKQGNNSTDKIEPKFKIGDWVVRGDTIAQILDIQEQYYIGLDINGKDFVSSRFLNDDKIHLWTLQDAKDGNVLVNGSNIFIFHHIDNKRLMGYCHVNMDDGNLYNDIGRNECFCTIDAPITPATKEQRDILYQKIKEKKEKFDPKTLKPFDKVLARCSDYKWVCDMFSHYDKSKCVMPYLCVGGFYEICISYNDETKHLVGTTEEAPKYYRYWEE